MDRVEKSSSRSGTRRHRSRSSSFRSDERRSYNHRQHNQEPRGHRSNRPSRNDEDERRGSGQRRRHDGEDRKHRRSRSPYDDTKERSNRDSKHRSRDQSPPGRKHSADRDTRHLKEKVESQVTRKNNGPLPSQESSFSMMKDPSMALVSSEDKPIPEKQKPNFAPSGLLAAASNSVTQADGTSIALKYHEPPEARKPSAKDQWKLFVFKGSEIVETVELSIRSCWLIGRDLAVVDLPAEHPSISKQHAVIQFRWIEKKNEFGDKLGKVRPYLIDLESANGTILNKDPVPGSRYLELRDKDMIQFGDSTREYVLMLPPRD